jgi:hypothetical protein
MCKAGLFWLLQFMDAASPRHLIFHFFRCAFRIDSRCIVLLSAETTPGLTSEFFLIPLTFSSSYLLTFSTS